MYVSQYLKPLSRINLHLLAIAPNGQSFHGDNCYNYVIMGAIASQITSLTIVYSTVYSGADQRKHQSSASLASVRGFQRWPVNSPHKGPEKRKMFPFDDVIMAASILFARFTWVVEQWPELVYIDGLVQDCSNSIANALGLLQPCTKTRIWYVAKICIACAL